MARPGAFSALPITMLAFLLCRVAAGQAAIADPEPSCSMHLESVPTQRIRATLTLDASVPNLCAREWIVVAPQPVELPGQSQIQSSLAVNGHSISSPDAWERSAFHRPILCTHVPIDNNPGQHSLRIQTVYEATLFARRLVVGPSPLPIAPLSLLDRVLSTSSTQTTDWNAPAFRQWLDQNDLQRTPRETELDFAERTFRVIRRAYVYGYEPEQDRRVSAICRTDRADCGGLSNLFVAALRANGIPARLIVGRWAHSAGPDDRCQQLHVKSEFYLSGVGWVPVEMSGAVSDKAAPMETYFGCDTGEFLALSVNPDFIFDTGGWGRKHLLALQGPCYWGIGEGTFAGCSEQVTWNVAPESLMASASP